MYHRTTHHDNTIRPGRAIVATLLIAGSTLSVASKASAQVCTDFDPPAPGAPWYCCGTIFNYDGIEFKTHAFQHMDGTWATTGFAEPWNACNGAGGYSLHINNVNVGVRIPDFYGYDGVGRITFFYRDEGGSVNLRVNGDLESTYDNLHAIPANRFHPVGVHLNVTAA